mmetsp:Transcript_28948/g.67190  ORF Transcript_28948/g.67190 Transcript_28948/m.67190 type:complete len:117 (+) Transcript_28948:204-554(+)
MVRPRVAIVAPNEAVLQKFQSSLKERAASVGIHPFVFDDNTTLKKIAELLENFCIDVVVVAPAISQSVALEKLPESWGGKEKVDQVVIVAKPVNAMQAIRTESWISNRNDWHLEGL